MEEPSPLNCAHNGNGYAAPRKIRKEGFMKNSVLRRASILLLAVLVSSCAGTKKSADADTAPAQETDAGGPREDIAPVLRAETPAEKADFAKAAATVGGETITRGELYACVLKIIPPRRRDMLFALFKRAAVIDVTMEKKSHRLPPEKLNRYINRFKRRFRERNKGETIEAVLRKQDVPFNVFRTDITGNCKVYDLLLSEGKVEEHLSPFADKNMKKVRTFIENMVAKLRPETKQENLRKGIVLKIGSREFSEKQFNTFLVAHLFKRDALNILVAMKLVDRELAEQRMRFTEDDKDYYFKVVSESREVTNELPFETYLKLQKMTVETYRNTPSFIITAKISKFTRKTIAEDAIKKAYRQRKKLFGDGQIRARHILAAVPRPGKASPAEFRKALAKIKKVQARLKAGEDFGTVAREVSDCPSGKRSGGDLGYFPRYGRGAMVEEFGRKAYSMEKGDVSGPVKTQFGYHIIEVTGIRSVTYEKYRPVVLGQLLAAKREEWLRKMRQKVKVEEFIE